MAVATGNLPPAPTQAEVIDNTSQYTYQWKVWFEQLFNKVGGKGSYDFTPTISTDGTAGTVTYVARSGRFSKIGTICLAEISIEISNWTGSPTGDVIIGGLPETINSINPSGSVSSYNKITLNASHSQLGLVGAQNQKYAYLYSSGSGAGITSAKIPVANIATTAKIICNMIYSV